VLAAVLGSIVLFVHRYRIPAKSRPQTRIERTA
jgi:hypothetical protein